MADSAARKRKAVTRDVESVAAAVSGDEYEFGELEGASSDSEDSLSESASSVNEDDFLIAKDASSHIANNGSDIQVNGRPQATENQEEIEKRNYRVVRDANGKKRYLYDEIDPLDDSDYSAVDDETNTIGNIPLSFYEQYPHIGYNINGKKIMRPATGEALDALLDSIEVPKGFTGLTDPSTGKPLELTPEELQLLRRVQQNEVPEEGYNPYEPTVEYFTSKTETMPLSAAPEPKRRFIPSKHEAKRVMKIVRAIREGRILPYKAPEEQDQEDREFQSYDIWANEESRPDHAIHMPAPKLPPPVFDESYHPPPEYLPDKKEKKEWEETDPEDRDKDYLPTDHKSLRTVPGYANFVKEKFDRCLDLYLAPRVRRSKLNIDPESLLPKLPSPEELKPFPTTCSKTFLGHEGRVRTCAFDPSGRYLATGGDDGARVWEVEQARQVWSVTFNADEVVNVVRWRPGKDASILSIAAGDAIYLAVPQADGLALEQPELEQASESVLDAGWGTAATNGNTQQAKSTGSPTWVRPPLSLQSRGVLVSIPTAHGSHAPKSLSFHRHGNYIVTISPSSNTPARQAVAIHTLSTHRTQYPFAKRLKGGGTPQTAQFHPSKPILFVANQRVIRAYDLTRQTLVKIIQPGARWISSFDIHPSSSLGSVGDNLIVGSYDRKLLYHDLDLSPLPYKTLRYHGKAIRAVRFHPRYSLFMDGSDDGSVQIFHGEVGREMMENARIVPLKVLKGHTVTGGLGVMDVDWHPSQPWAVSAGGDGTARLWV